MKLLTNFTVRYKGTTYDVHCLCPTGAGEAITRGERVFRLGENYVMGPIGSVKLLGKEMGLDVVKVTRQMVWGD